MNKFQQGMLNMMQSRAGNNPIFANAVNMAQNGNSGGVEQLVRNICAQRGIDPDKAMADLQEQMSGKQASSN